jgi:hypothetical protein
MRPQIGDTGAGAEPEQLNSARTTNWEHGDDVIIAGAMSEWVLMGLQWWRSVARHEEMPARNNLMAAPLCAARQRPG